MSSPSNREHRFHKHCGLQHGVAWERLRSHQGIWDLAVVGGGATGLGIAVDAAARGYDVVLLEQSDFGKGTSSRSTKLIHGGVRYLQQGNLSLVMEALKERGLLSRNAPHLVRDLPFVVPNYQWWEAPFYGTGLKIYDLLAGKYGFGGSKLLSRNEVLERIPTLEPDGLRGGVLYHDAQFDDSRLLINLAQTATELGACVLNYVKVEELLKDADGAVNGLGYRNQETLSAGHLRARCVINATGPFCQELRRKDDPDASRLIAPSQGVHLVLDHSFLPGETAMMVPHTRDGRVVFAIPWKGHVVVGTTDTPIAEPCLEPRPLDTEIEFLLETADGYLAKPPQRRDILSVFTGIRPLVRSSVDASTSAMSREHLITISRSGLLTIVGGKWTTYRRMAEDCVDHATVLAGLDERPCKTHELAIHGACPHPHDGPFVSYGSDAEQLEQLMAQEPHLAQRLHPALPIYAVQVAWAVRHEMARTLDDVLARRTRALYLNARAALEMVDPVLDQMAHELGRDGAWCEQQRTEFQQIARHFLANGKEPR